MTTPSAEPQRGPRPGVVTVAAWFQLAVVVLALAMVALTWVAYALEQGYIAQAASETAAERGEVGFAESANLFGSVMTTVLAGACAVWFGATLVPVLRGSNAGRIVSVVGAGLGTAFALVGCVCGGLFSVMLMPFLAMPDMPIEDAPADGSWAPTAFEQRHSELMDGTMWLQLGSGTAVMLVSLFTVVILVLLLVPPANRWYSPPPPPQYYPYPPQPPTWYYPPSS